MVLNGGKLTPGDNMHLKCISTEEIFEGAVYLPSSLSKKDFEEVAHSEYLKFIGEEVEEVTREEYEEMEKRVGSLEEDVTDLKAPDWSAGKSYVSGDEIRYNGVVYVVLQNHPSQAHWTPDVVASLYKVK